MDINGLWEKALKKTEIIRSRIQGLNTFADTRVPYIFLAESTLNVGDTLVRKGEVVVQRPSLLLPPHIPQFKGFEFSDKEISDDSLINFLLVRGINLPSLKYNNTVSSLDIFEDKLSAAIGHYQKNLQSQENVHTGLLAGPEDCWQFSIMIFICAQIMRNANYDIRKLLEEYKRKEDKS